MPHIALPADLPGIRGAMAFRPETARPLNALVEILLTGPSTLSRGERELIATYVSSRNCTHYCHSIHGAIAAAHLGGDEALVKQVKTDFTQAAISPKLKALLTIAGKVAGVSDGFEVWPPKRLKPPITSSLPPLPFSS